MFNKLRGLFRRSPSNADERPKGPSVRVAPGTICLVYEDVIVDADGKASFVDSEGFARSVQATAIIDGGQPWPTGCLITLKEGSKRSELIVIRKTLEELHNKFREQDLVLFH